ncbi:MAG: AAA family ATPase [Deltaproteobacteria bacterium]|nr:AAA family ATPase [Deltaproteobacteria bacterium]
MAGEKHLVFGPFRLDPDNECLWQGEEELQLPPKAFAVLHYLMEHHGRLVTKDELFRAVWSDVAVGDAALTFSVGEIRRALGDNSKAPQFIETVHRRGYRFIGKISGQRSAVSRQQLETRNLQLATHLVGREAELAQLQRWLGKALEGERQVVFVTGEPGIGKTRLVDAFVAQVAASGTVWIGRGQCIEQYGAGEAYLPVLEALGRLCRESGGERLIDLLGQHAPTWLVQMPSLLSAAELEGLQRKVLGATRERMLREMAEALEALTAEKPLVLWLEDLHWSDYSTLELLSFWARRQERARLLVIGTYRPVEVIMSSHPLKGVKQELQLHGQCEELPLGYLTEAAVGEYLAVRFPESQLPARLVGLIHQRTDGNPLFLVNVADYLVAQGSIVQCDGRWELKAGLEAVEVGVPENLQQMIERQIDRLSSEERRVLEVASVAGVESSAAAVAAGVEAEVGEVEKQCAGLARREQFLRSHGTDEWPDGTVAARYGFMHALYQEVLYERMTVRRRIELHRRIGEREEAAYGGRAGEIAAELAVHFGRGRDYQRAVQYLRQAGENATRRSAYVEAISLLTKGLELLKTLPDTPERTQQELVLQTALGPPLVVTKGQAAPEVRTAYTRAWELCQQVGETPQLFPVLFGLWVFYAMRAESKTAQELGERLMRLAQSAQDPELLLEAHRALGATLYLLGEFAPARGHLERSIALYDPQQHHAHAFLYGFDPGLSCLCYESWTLWLLGYPDQALKRSHESLRLAQELSHPWSLAVALGSAFCLHQFRREVQAVQERAEAMITLCSEEGFPTWLAAGTLWRGWVLAEQGQAEEGIAQMRQGIAAIRATGAELARPYNLALLAEAYGKVGQAEEGLTLLAEALDLVHKTGERNYEAELYRLKGELTLAQSRVQRLGSRVQKEAEECFRQAIDIARRQSAKSWELRAVISLSRLWQKQGKKAEARQMLAEIYGWFTEGFDTADLKEAKALLEKLGDR